MHPDLPALLQAAARAADRVGDADWRPDLDFLQAVNLGAQMQAYFEWDFEAGVVVITHKPTGATFTEPLQPDPAAAMQRGMVRLAASLAPSTDGSAGACPDAGAGHVGAALHGSGLAVRN